MPDQFTTTTTTGYGSRIGSSFGGAIVGVLLFLGSFGLLFWNEGRTDLSLIAKDAIQMDATAQNAGAEGKLVAVSGTMKADASIGDDLFLKPGKYLSVYRNVEMYAWAEKKDEKTTKNVGGSETTETTYTYQKDWTDSPETSSDFQHPEGHENPVQAIKSDDVTAAAIQVGNYSLQPTSLELPSGDVVPLTPQTTTVTSTKGAVLANQEYIFIPAATSSSITAPQIGDLRVSYEGVASDQQMVVFGQLHNTTIEPYAAKGGETLYRAFIGTKDTAVADLHGEYTMLSWILRLVGFLMMWIGLSMFLDPLSTLLDVLPIAGSLTRGLIGAIAFVVALILTAITVIVSMILHSMVAIIIAPLVAVGIGITVMKSRKKKTVGQPAS